MAVTAQAAALTEAERLAQARNGALVAYVVAQLWLRSIDPDDIDGSSFDLINRLLPMAPNGRRMYRVNDCAFIEVAARRAPSLPPCAA